jgi:glutaredoxin
MSLDHIKEVGHKIVAGLILITFSYVIYLEVLHPFFAALPGSTASQVRYSLQESQRMFEELGGTPGGKPIVVFVTSWCPVCRALEHALKGFEVRYVRADIEKDQTAAVYYQVLTQGRSTGVPLTVVGTKVFVGYDVKGIMGALEVLPAIPQRPAELARNASL